MAKRIGRAHRLGKQNRKQPGITNDSSKTNLATSNSYNKPNENFVVLSEESLSAETDSSTRSAVQFSSAYLIQT